MKTKYFYPERPRLMAEDQPLFDRLDHDRTWVAEPKINGTRLQLHLVDGAWEFWGRHGDRLTYQPSPDVIKALNSLGLKGYWLFDGELRHNKTKGVQHRICLYDVFIAQENLLLGMPFRDRRAMLERIVFDEYPSWSILTMPRQYSGYFRLVFNQLIQEDEIEGLVIKNLNGKLALGRNNAVDSAWMWKVRKPNGSYKM